MNIRYGLKYWIVILEMLLFYYESIGRNRIMAEKKEIPYTDGVCFEEILYELNRGANVWWQYYIKFIITYM